MKSLLPSHPGGGGGGESSNTPQLLHAVETEIKHRPHKLLGL